MVSEPNVMYLRDKCLKSEIFYVNYFKWNKNEIFYKNINKIKIKWWNIEFVLLFLV